MMVTLAMSLDKFHGKRIIHRNLCMDNIAVKVSQSKGDRTHEKLKL